MLKTQPQFLYHRIEWQINIPHCFPAEYALAESDLAFKAWVTRWQMCSGERGAAGMFCRRKASGCARSPRVDRYACRCTASTELNPFFLIVHDSFISPGAQDDFVLDRECDSLGHKHISHQVRNQTFPESTFSFTGLIHMSPPVDARARLWFRRFYWSHCQGLMAHRSVTPLYISLL
jgi:hypothetical protein